MRTKRPKRSFLDDYIKVCKKILRETVGITPTKISKNSKKYNRKKLKEKDRKDFEESFGY
jgi:hypothetical protein